MCDPTAMILLLSETPAKYVPPATAAAAARVAIRVAPPAERRWPRPVVPAATYRLDHLRPGRAGAAGSLVRPVWRRRTTAAAPAVAAVVAAAVAEAPPSAEHSAHSSWRSTGFPRHDGWPAAAGPNRYCRRS